MGQASGMEAAPVHPLEVILSLSRAMVAAAQRGEWDVVTAQEQDRRVRIERYFAQGPDLAASAGLAEAIRTLVALDQQVVELGKARRNQIVDALRGLGQGRRGTLAYQQTGR